MYKINDWNVTNIDFLTPKPGSIPGSSDFVTFNIPDLTIAPYSNIYTDYSVIATSEYGNSFEVVAKFDDNKSNTYFEMYIADRTNKDGIHIFNGSISYLDGTNVIPVQNTDSDAHKYTLTLQNGLLRVFFDEQMVLQRKTTNTSINPEMRVGFTKEQTGSAILNLKYVKRAKGVYNYIKPKNIDFELLIDAVDTFDSPNLKTYTKDSFSIIKQNPESWDTVSLVCGDFGEDGYKFNGLVQSATIHLPPKQDGIEIPFYYKVRFNNTEYTSDFSQTYLTNRIKPEQLVLQPKTISLKEVPATKTTNTKAQTQDIYKILSEKDAGYKAYRIQDEGGNIVLPPTPVSDGWSVQIYNAGETKIHIIDALSYEIAEINPKEIVSCTYSTTNNNWNSCVLQKKQKFVLLPNITNIVFDAVYNHHLPAYDEVYTKAFNSGNAADILRGKATQIDDFYASLRTQYANLSNFTANRDDMNQRWSTVFGLDKSLFKNSADMRDIMQTLLLNVRGELLANVLSYVISAITGANPEIIEYKDIDFNVLWSSADIKRLPMNKTYYLYDDEHPSLDVNPFIVYGGADQAFTYQINVFDPYNLTYNQELIKQIIEMFKPVYSYVVVNFYSSEGLPYTKRYYYGTDNYLEAAYNK